MSPRILVTLVTYNSGRYLRHSLPKLRAQRCTDFSIHLWDNASEDDSAEIISEYGDFLDSVHFSTRNIGFCAAHNRLIASAASDYVFVLNPDVILDAMHLERLMAALDGDATAGAATGKLWRWNLPQGSLPAGDEYSPSTQLPILDTTGIYFTPTQRHFDRGSGEPDRGQYGKREYVFGASGAAAFYRRAMLDDVRAGSEYFDEAFFAYREDADLAWRAQWLGWRCLYVPEAVGYHVRQVLPEKRRAVAREINMHSFKNRFLMRVKNMDAITYARFFLPITLRDLGALGYVLLLEQYSLRAIPLILKALPRAWAIRTALKNHRRVTPRELRAWFRNRPSARPAP
jgi:GT2 family glycosyltransferase